MFKPKDGELVFKFSVPKDSKKDKLKALTRYALVGIPIALLIYGILCGR